MFRSIILFGLLFLAILSHGQNTDRISIFLDCANTRCDRTYIRTELPIVDYSRDRIESDIHVLLTSQRTGSGGRGYQIIFFGQEEFSEIIDTLNFSLEPMSSDVQRRVMVPQKTGQ